MGADASPPAGGWSAGGCASHVVEAFIVAVFRSKGENSPLRGSSSFARDGGVVGGVISVAGGECHSAFSFKCGLNRGCLQVIGVSAVTPAAGVEKCMVSSQGSDPLAWVCSRRELCPEGLAHGTSRSNCHSCWNPVGAHLRPDE